MKEIVNIKSLESGLVNENPDWKQNVFDKLGIWININGDTQGDWVLVSAVGGFSREMAMDEDVFGDEDNHSAPSFEIHNVNELIEYIRSMEVYQYYLKDVSLGTFRKSDLFWAIESKILTENVDADGRVYVLHGIYGPGRPYFDDMLSEDLWLDFAVRGCDEIPGIYLKKEHRASLDMAVLSVAKQLGAFRNNQDWTPDSVPPFKYNASAEYRVPSTVEDLIAAYNQQDK